MTSRQKVGGIGRLTGSGYGKRNLGLELEPDRQCRLRYGLVVGVVHRGLSAVCPTWVFCSIGVPGEGVEPSWGRMGGGIEPRLYRSARAHGGYRMAQSVGGRWVVEGKWVKESQQFPSEHLDFQVVADTNSHQMHYSVATLDRPSPRHRQPEPCPPWSPWRRSWSS